MGLKRCDLKGKVHIGCGFVKAGFQGFVESFVPKHEMELWQSEKFKNVANLAELKTAVKTHIEACCEINTGSCLLYNEALRDFLRMATVDQIVSLTKERLNDICSD